MLINNNYLVKNVTCLKFYKIDIDDTDLTSKGLTESLEIAEKNKDAIRNDSNIQKIIDKLKAQMQRVLNWIMNMFKHYDKLFQEGANFVKQNDLNQCMTKIKSNRINVDVTWHARRPTFQNINTICTRNLQVDKWAMKIEGKTTVHTTMGASNRMAGRAETELASGDKTEGFLNDMMRQFKLDKENLVETKITAINVLVIHNNLISMPEANRKLNQLKTKLQNVYNRAINNVRSTANTVKEKKAIKADNKLSHINAMMKDINERIRAYAKIMSMVFKEDYNLAKLIVAKANGNDYSATTDEKVNQEQQPQQKQSKSKKESQKENKKRWFNKPI